MSEDDRFAPKAPPHWTAPEQPPVPPGVRSGSEETPLNRFLGGWSSLCDALHRLPELPSRFVDVGTGDGDVPLKLLDYLASRGVAASCVALDHSERVLAIAAQRIGDRPDIALALGDARPFAMPFGIARLSPPSLSLRTNPIARGARAGVDR